MRTPIHLAKAIGRKLDREGIRGEAIPLRNCLAERVADAPTPKDFEEGSQIYQRQQLWYNN